MSGIDSLSRADLAGMAGEKRLHGQLFSLISFPLPASRNTALACIVTKKIAAKANARNRIKRRCREAVRAHARQFPPRSPVALIFRAKRGVTGAAFSAVREEIGVLIDKIADSR